MKAYRWIASLHLYIREEVAMFEKVKVFRFLILSAYYRASIETSHALYISPAFFILSLLIQLSTMETLTHEEHRILALTNNLT